MSDLPDFLAQQQRSYRPVSGAELEKLGKEAARRWCDGSASSLHEAVVGLVKTARLSPEQVRRVVEFTNVTAYLNSFQKSGSEHRYIDFGDSGPAHPAAVLQDLNDGGGGTVFDMGTRARHQVDSIDDATFYREMFPKTASAKPEAPADPLAPVKTARAELLQAKKEAEEFLRGQEYGFQLARTKLASEVQDVLLGGFHLGDVVNALGSTGASPDLLKVAMLDVLNQMVSSGVFRGKTAAVESLQKTAGEGDVDLEHPLLAQFSEYTGHLAKLAHARKFLAEVDQGLAQLESFSKKANEHGVIGAGARHLWNASKSVGETGRNVGRWLGGETGANIGYAAGRAGTLLAPLIAANEVYKRAPILQKGVSAAKSVVPGTDEYYMSAMQQDPYAMMGGY